MLNADANRIMADLEAVSDFGRVSETAVTRLAFTTEDDDAHDYVGKLMRAEGLQTSFDSFGNLFGRRPGQDSEAEPIATGSHLDGPPNGGRFDGTAGVVCAVEAVRLLNSAGIQTARPIDVVAIRCEHVDRFGLSCLGSRALAGKLTENHLDDLQDQEGITLREAIKDAGHDPDQLRSASLKGRVAGFIELHIEQGRVLEDAGQPLGLITAIAGPTRCILRLKGLADHSGGTPMSLRRDAFSGAAEIALALEAICRESSSSVGTVGSVRVSPGAFHTVPGDAEMWIDIRGVEPNEKREVVRRFREGIIEITKRRDLEFSMDCSVDEDPVPTSENITLLLSQTLQREGFDFRVMPSGGGHDTQHLADITDVGMIFIPSIRGISHTPEELTTPEQMAIGASALASGISALAA